MLIFSITQKVKINFTIRWRFMRYFDSFQPVSALCYNLLCGRTTDNKQSIYVYFDTVNIAVSWLSSNKDRATEETRRRFVIDSTQKSQRRRKFLGELNRYKEICRNSFDTQRKSLCVFDKKNIISPILY